MDLDQLFERSPDLLCIAGTDGYFRRLNPSFERVLGWTVEELMARPFLDLVHSEDVAATLGEVEKLSRGIPTVHFENRYRCKNGGYKRLAWATAPSPDGTLYAMARDVTAEHAVREEAAQVQAELEAFSYSVSHDLRAPLRAIDGFAKILAEDHTAQLDAEGQRVVGIIQDNARRMGQLIDDLLRFSRLGRCEVTMRGVDMNALAQSAAEEVLAGAGREIALSIEPMPRVLGDTALLRQVWLNLIGNAVKFARDQPAPAIRVRAEAGAGSNVFSVADNGAGFDMRYVDKVFGVFQRLHASGEFEGTGIGLALVRRIVERHGGRTWAVGEVGAGATFSFSLPSLLKGIGHGR